MKNVIIIALLAVATITTACNRNQAITEPETTTQAETKADPNDKSKREAVREQARNVDPNNVAGEVIEFMEGRVTMTDDQRAGVAKLADKYDFSNMSFQEQRQSARALRKEIKGMLSESQLEELKNGKKKE